MKFISNILILLIAGNLYAKDTVKLAGKITSPLCDSIVVSYNDNFLAFYPKHFVGKLDKKGNYSIQFPVPAGNYTIAEVVHGDKVAEILLAGGDSLYMTVNARRFDSTVHYGGIGSGVANFMAQHTVDKGRMNQYTLKIRNLVNKEPLDFSKAIEDEYELEIKYLNNSKEKLPPSFISYWKAFYKYYNYFFSEQYPLAHEMIRLRRYTDTIPDTNYTVVRKMKRAFNDSLLQVPSYLLYLTGVLESKLKADGYTWIGKDTTRMLELEDSVNRMAARVLPDKSAEYFMAQDIYGRAKMQRLPRTEAQFADFKRRWPESNYLPLLEKQVGMAEKLAPGQPAPNIDIITQEGTRMKLSDLKGKVVYLDFWASWCKQCVGEMAGSKKLKDMVRKEPVTFVYLALDTDTTMQHTILNHYKIDGTFSRLADSWNSKEVELYGVQGLPSYFLIDTEGKFALQHTPAPVDAIGMLLEIEKLIKRKD